MDTGTEGRAERALRERVAELEGIVAWQEDRLRELLTGLSTDPVVAALGVLPPTQATVLGLLMQREQVSSAQAMAAIYGGHDDPPHEADVVRAWMSRVRLRLVPHGIDVESSGEGIYRIRPEHKRALRELAQRIAAASAEPSGRAA